jgi:hypothetical protein
VKLEEQWREMGGGLPEDWSSIQLSLTLAEDEHADRVALILAPFTPGRTGSRFRFALRRDQDPGRVLRRLDQEDIRGLLELVGSEKVAAPTPHERRSAERVRPLAAQWNELAGALPPDWSDVYAEVELDSTDFLQRGALLLSPMNPARYGGAASLRFRIARVSGYGAAPTMARRCLERLDEEAITGTLRFLRVLSATSHVATQGPVWRVAGRSV